MKTIDEKVQELININGGNFIFSEFYSHEDKNMLENQKYLHTIC